MTSHTLVNLDQLLLSFVKWGLAPASRASFMGVRPVWSEGTPTGSGPDASILKLFIFEEGYPIFTFLWTPQILLLVLPLRTVQSKYNSAY